MTLTIMDTSSSSIFYTLSISSLNVDSSNSATQTYEKEISSMGIKVE